jgi:hypothetical protein
MDALVTVEGMGVGMNGTMGFFSFNDPGGSGEKFGLFRANRIWVNGEKIKASNFKTPEKFEKFFKETLQFQSLKADIIATDNGESLFKTTDGQEVRPTFYSRCVWTGEVLPPEDERLEKPKKSQDTAQQICKPVQVVAASQTAVVTSDVSQIKNKTQQQNYLPGHGKQQPQKVALKQPSRVLKTKVSGESGTIVLKHDSGTCFISFTQQVYCQSHLVHFFVHYGNYVSSRAKSRSPISP